MPLTNSPSYPVVHPKPGLDLIIRNVRATDVLTVAAFASFSFAVNWFGARGSLRYANSRFMGLIGLMGGCLYADLTISQRLMGLYPNEPEVERFGAYTAAELEDYAKNDIANGELIGRVPKEREIR